MPERTNLFFLLLLIASVLNAQKPGDKVFSVFVDETCKKLDFQRRSAGSAG